MTRIHKQQQGVMLIEAMIGILIFSIGILALMGLQALSIKNTIEAKYRTEASFWANQLIGAMWADCGISPTICATTLGNYNTATGTSTKMTTWRTNVAGSLPGITVGGTNSPTITVAGNAVTITVFWKLPSAPAADPAHQLSVTAQINI